MSRWTAVLISFVSVLGMHDMAAGAPGTLRVDLGAQQLEGMPVHWTEGSVQLLGRDGALWEFAPNATKGFQQQSATFVPYSQAELRGQLLREFGAGYEVTGTGHFLVVHPAGRGELWSDRFEQLYGSIMHYFTARRFRLSKPQFPLVAVVFPSQQAFMRYAQQDGGPVSPNVLGYYSIRTNRNVLFEQGPSKDEPQSWLETADTIIHEATHQTAFNVGVHSRHALPPRWLAEGLGTMFEARGVWDSRQYSELADRLNAGRLRDYRHFAAAGATRPRGQLLGELVAHDRIFSANPAEAYAYGWALTFYLAERHTSKLSRYLQLTADRPPYEPYSSSQRLEDFVRVFGTKLELFDTHFVQFMESLPR